MSFSFIDIEEKKSRLIIFIFLGIVAFYFLTAFLLLVIFENSIFIYLAETQRSFTFLPPLKHILIALLVALIAAFLHWTISTSNIIDKMSVALGALPLDSRDTYHQYFKNILDEVSVATGGKCIESWVIPSAAMNAFSLKDFEGRSIIGITEGLLARLNRPQIEAVVGHEAGHVVSGDSLIATVVVSLSELYEQTLSRLRVSLRHTRGRGGLPIFLIFLVLAVMNFLSKLLRCFLSRQREYRADAIAVRLTRNPLSLAEALKLISKGWHGSGSAGERLEAIFIVNPRFENLDEQESFFAELFSTHPPVKKRIEVLLNIAHLNEKTLEENLKHFRRVSPVAVAEFKPDYTAGPKRWFVFEEGNWLGPFVLDEIKKLDNFTPQQWVRPDGLNMVMPAYQDDDLRAWFLSGSESKDKFYCPHCRISLDEVNYEGVPVLKCSFCQGVLVDQNKVSRILIRKDKIFSQETERLTKAIIDEKGKFILKDSDTRSVWVINCPRCQRKMRRQFFVYSYPVEIDRCIYCDSVWFDQQELEILQYIYEHKEKFLL